MCKHTVRANNIPCVLRSRSVFRKLAGCNRITKLGTQSPCWRMSPYVMDLVLRRSRAQAPRVHRSDAFRGSARVRRREGPARGSSLQRQLVLERLHVLSSICVRPVVGRTNFPYLWRTLAAQPLGLGARLNSKLISERMPVHPRAGLGAEGGIRTCRAAASPVRLRIRRDPRTPETGRSSSFDGLVGEPLLCEVALRWLAAASQSSAFGVNIRRQKRKQRV
jgi:hypothetical protein